MDVWCMVERHRVTWSFVNVSPEFVHKKLPITDKLYGTNKLSLVLYRHVSLQIFKVN